MKHCSDVSIFFKDCVIPPVSTPGVVPPVSTPGAVSTPGVAEPVSTHEHPTDIPTPAFEVFPDFETGLEILNF